MSFTAEWTPARGFNTSGYTVTFGKPLNQCSVTELLAHPMCGSNNPIANCAYVAKYSDLGYSSVAMHLLNAQFKEPIPNGQSNTWVCDPAPTGDLAKIYRRTIFVGMPTNVTAPQYCLTDESDSRILIIENIKDPNKLVYNYGNITFSAGAVAQYRTCANQIRHTCNKGQSTYSSAPSTVTYEDPDTHTTTVYKICAYQVYVIDNDCFICGWDYIGYFLGRYQNENNAYNGLTWGSSFTSFKHENGNCLFIGTNVNATGSETNLEGIFGDDIYADPVPDPAVFVNTNVDYAPTNIELQNVKLRFHMSNSTIGGSLRSCTLTVDLYDTEEIRKQQMARAGIYFAVNGELFKPIISGGIVTGYGTPDKVSEIDTYTDLNHPVPSGGGTPPSPSGDDMEAMATGATGSSGGFTHFYVMSPQDLIDFLADFYDHASSGETLTNNLVCSYILGIPSSEFCATQDVPIAIHNSAQGTPFVSQADYAHITATNNLLVIGSFNVPRITNTFYDFAPYSTYEVFIPCCGWVSLPDTVAGRKINVEMYIDIASCCLKAAVKTNDLGVCAVTNGVLGASIPIAVIESGILRGNIIQAGLGIIGGGINTGVGAGSGNAMGIGFGVQQILSGLVDCTIAGNTNYTQQKGGTGDITQFAMGHKCYMKVTHPDIDPVVNETMFGHSVGYLCNSIDELSNFKGFTVCGNPHVTFSASAEEREEIERLLSIGVIL